MESLLAEKDIKKITSLKGHQLYSHQRRKRIIIQLIDRLYPDKCSILDVGCASGDISVELSSLNHKVYGIDFEPNRLLRAKKVADKYGQKVIFENKSFEEIKKYKTFDVVLLGEVLEHFEDPKAVLKEVKSLLKKHGSVVITVPNMPSLRNRIKFGLFGIFPDNNPEHKYYFDFDRFRRVAREAGFIISYWKTYLTTIFYNSKLTSILQNMLLFWFTYLLPRSGDFLIVVISPETTAKNNDH